MRFSISASISSSWRRCSAFCAAPRGRLRSRRGIGRRQHGQLAPQLRPAAAAGPPAAARSGLLACPRCESPISARTARTAAARWPDAAAELAAAGQVAPARCAWAFDGRLAGPRRSRGSPPAASSSKNRLNCSGVHQAATVQQHRVHRRPRAISASARAELGHLQHGSGSGGRGRGQVRRAVALFRCRSRRPGRRWPASGPRPLGSSSSPSPPSSAWAGAASVVEAGQHAGLHDRASAGRCR